MEEGKEMETSQSSSVVIRDKERRTLSELNNVMHLSAVPKD